jgi:hypothetical protein
MSYFEIAGSFEPFEAGREVTGFPDSLESKP